MRRGFWTAVPIRMGRRSAKIATRKGAQDLRKSKLYGRIGKLIVQAVKKGGPSATSNDLLAAALQQARLYDVPKDIVDRNIKRASEKGQQDFAEMMYEVYGFGGVGLVLDVLTDNNARAAASVRDIVKKAGAKMADPGSVLFNFKRCAVVAVPFDSVKSVDNLFLAAMDAGADDVLEADADSEVDEQGDGDRKCFRVIASVEKFATMRDALASADFFVDSESSGLQLLPVSNITVDDDAAERNAVLMEKLLQLDDVDAVYCNQS